MAGMARVGVEAMVSHFGCRPQELRVALGPCIGRCCFEVGDEVVDAFAAAMPAPRHSDVVLFAPGQRSRIDLRAFQRAEIEAAGVLHDNVDASTDCTLCDAGRRFFSFRGAGRSTGQLLGFILRK
jgi:hypothetical protein